ncbi:MAG: hypothetical protein MHM6MM_004083 [Cercozoa sp. M6MM]
MVQWRSHDQPLVVLLRIAVLQLLFYLTLWLFRWLLMLLSVLSSEEGALLDGQTAVWWQWLALPVLVWLNGEIVHKSRRVLDYVATTYFFHLVLVCANYGLPRRSGWWLGTISQCAVLVTLSELQCRKREINAVSSSVLFSSSAPTPSTQPSAGNLSVFQSAKQALQKQARTLRRRLALLTSKGSTPRETSKAHEILPLLGDPA